VQSGRDPNKMSLWDTNEKLSKDKMKPIKTQCPSVCCFYSNSETFGFHLQPGPKQRQTCMLYFRHSFLAFLFFYFFFLIQFFKVNPKKEKESSFVSNLSSLPFACRLSPQTPTHVPSMLSDLPLRISQWLGLEHPRVKPRNRVGTRGSV